MPKKAPPRTAALDEIELTYLVERGIGAPLRGVQTGAASARIADPAAAGCDVAVVTTQPGGPSLSSTRSVWL